MVTLINGKSQEIQADGSVSFSSDQSMGGFKLVDVATPIDSQDAVNKDYVDQLLILANPHQLWVDDVSGDDTDGTGSILKPLKSITKALTLCTGGDNYVIMLAPGNYAGADLTWKDNVSLYGFGGTAAVNQNINYTAGVAAESGIVFNGIGLGGTFTADLSPANLAFITLYNGTYNITRTDSTPGGHVVQILSSTIGDISTAGSMLISNSLFVSTCSVQVGGTLLLVGCTFGIGAEIYGTAQVFFTSSTFVGSINGNIDSGNTPQVFIDSSSDLGTFTGDITVTYTDNAEFITYNPSVFGNWQVLPTTVQEALDDLSALESIPRQQEIYVAKDGDDATATGSMARPFLTISAAEAAIVDASDTNKYAIYISPGEYSEVSLVIKPNINLVSFGTHDAVSSLVAIDATSISLHSSWNTATSNTSTVFQGIRFNGDSTFDGNAVSAAGGVIEFNQCQFQSPLTLTSYQGNLHFNALYASVTDGLSHSGGGQLSGQWLISGGTFSSTSEAGYPTQLVLVNGFSFVPTTITCAVGDTINVFAKDHTFGSTLTLDGAGITFNTTVSSFPIISNLTLSNNPTVNLLNDANGLGYSPTTPGDWSSVPTTVHGALDTLAATGGGGVGTYKKNRSSNGTISGVIDGSNAVFTLSNTPLTDTLIFSLNGLILTEVDHYSISGNTVTMVDAPESGDELAAGYIY